MVGAAYAPTVVAGVHHMYNIIEQGFLSNGGANIWMPIATAANVAQGAAALAVALKTKNKKLKAMAFPAGISAYLGITEPAIFGVNVRYKRPFIAGMIGGAVGGLFAALTHVGASAYGVTGVFGILITLPNSELGLGVWNIINYILTILIASAAAFIVSFIWYKDEAPCEKRQSLQSVERSIRISIVGREGSDFCIRRARAGLCGDPGCRQSCGSL